MKKNKGLLALIAAAFILSACGTSSSTPDSTTTSQAPTTSEPTSTSQGPQNHVITWEGIDDKVIPLGDEFDLLEGVKAFDSIDGELEVKVADDDYFDFNYVSQYTIKYEATNSVGTTSTKYRMIQVIKGPNVLNGSFTMGKTYWRFDLPGGSGTFVVTNEEARVTVTDSGAEAWAVQLYQTGLQFQVGKTYEMTFRAKSESGRSLSAGFENVSNNYAMLIPGYPAMMLNAEWQTYSALYTANDDYGAIKAVIYLGRGLDFDAQATKNNPLDVTIDDIKIREITLPEASKRPVFSNAAAVTVQTGDQFNALPPVTAVDYKGTDITNNIVRVGEVPSSIGAETRMLISYRVTDSEGNFNFINRTVTYRIARDNPYNLINADFTNGFQGWTRDVNQTNGNGSADWIVNEDGTVTANITSGSSDNWHIQLHQGNVSLQSGKIYRTTLRAKASVARKLTIEISNPATSYTRIATELVSLTTEFQTFVLEFKSTVTTSAKYALLLGAQGNNQVTIDKFENEQITAEEATTIDLRDYQNHEAINGDFKYGYYGWTKEATHGSEVEFIEDRENETIKLNVKTAGTANWHAQINQDGRSFQAGVEYTMTVVASALANTTIAMEVTNNNGETVIGRQNINLTTSTQTFTMTFTPSQNFTQGKVSLLIGTSNLTTITVTSVTITK